jgi:uncharacterized protein (DUF1778 family)
MFTDAAVSSGLTPDHGPIPTEAKSERLNARITPSAKAVLERAASLEGRSITDFVVAKAMEAAVRSIVDHERVVLTEREREAFFAALLAPPKPSDRARRAVARYRETFQTE